ncbi:hypothetical protein GW17_00017433 [Ensete ventricosum]|nr:hypothetical protein GW17_00017433 [Ensete ventricosum]
MMRPGRPDPMEISRDPRRRRVFNDGATWPPALAVPTSLSDDVAADATPHVPPPRFYDVAQVGEGVDVTFHFGGAEVGTPVV